MTAAFEALESEAAEVVVQALRSVVRSVVAGLDKPSWPVAPSVITASAEDELGRILTEWGSVVETRVMPLFHRTYRAGGMAAVFRMVELGHEPGDLAAVAAEEYMDEGARNHLANARNRFLEVGNTTWEKMRETMVAGFERGDGVDLIARELRRAADLSEATASMVARTEVISAANAGAARRMDIAAAQGEDIPRYKQWLSTIDERTRPSHVTADCQVVAEGELFQVGGSMLAYPGDPGGPAAEVINCRCTILFVETAAGECEGVEGRQEGGIVERIHAECSECPVGPMDLGSGESPFGMVADDNWRTDHRVDANLTTDNYRTDRRFAVEEIDPLGVAAGQGTVDRSYVAALRNKGGYNTIDYENPVVVVRAHGLDVLADGHHRAVAAGLDGKPLRGLVLDVSDEFRTLEAWENVVFGGPTLASALGDAHLAGKHSQKSHGGGTSGNADDVSKEARTRMEALTGPARQAHDDYTSVDYDTINGTLRGQRPLDAQTKAQIDGLDEAFGSAGVTTADPISVHRGVGDNAPAMTVGTRLTDDGYMSVTTSREDAELFAVGPRGRGTGRTLTIEVPAGQRVIAGDVNESEMILPRGSTLRITGVSGNAISAVLEAA